MTRARERLIVSGSVDFGKASEVPTPIAWVLERLEADEELAAAGDTPIELVARRRAPARARRPVPRGGGRRLTTSRAPKEGQLALFASLDDVGPAVKPAPLLPELAADRGTAAPPRPPPLVHGALDVRAVRLQVLGALRHRPRRSRTCRAAEGGLSGVEVGSRVHELLEHIDLAAPVVPEIEDERVRAHVTAYVDSPLARRLGSLPGVTKERHFTFEHDGVLVHGFLDVLQLRREAALVVDYKTNWIGESSPEEIVEADYRLQRLVYALACFRAGAEEVEVVYQFLERPDEPVEARFTLADVAELEAELSAAIARLQAGEFRPTPSEFACAGCPALDLVCAGPRLRQPPTALVAS